MIFGCVKFEIGEFGSRVIVVEISYRVRCGGSLYIRSIRLLLARATEGCPIGR